MRKAQFLGFSLLLTSVLFLQNSFAQDYTRWELPERAKSRFGKGLKTGNIEYSPDGRKLAVGSSIGVWLYDTANGAEINLFAGHTRPVRCVAVSPDGTILARGSGDMTIRLLQLARLAAVSRATNTSLLPNYPNPFNPETRMPYQLAKAAEVTFTIYDMNGWKVRTLAVGHQPAGVYQSRSRTAHWDGRNDAGEPVGSGVYWCTLDAGSYQETRKIVIQK